MHVTQGLAAVCSIVKLAADPLTREVLVAVSNRNILSMLSLYMDAVEQVRFIAWRRAMCPPVLRMCRSIVSYGSLHCYKWLAKWFHVARSIVLLLDEEHCAHLFYVCVASLL